MPETEEVQEETIGMPVEEDDEGEEVQDVDFTEAFNEAIEKAVGTEGEKETEPAPKEKGDEKKSAETKPAQEKTLQELAEERGKAVLAEQQKATTSPTTQTTTETQPVKTEEPKPKEESKPKAKEGYDDEEVSEFANDFPAAVKLAKAEALKAIDQKIADAEIVSQKNLTPFMGAVADDFKKLSDFFVESYNRISYVLGVITEHSDFLKVTKDPEFKGWFDKQPDTIKALSTNMNYEDGVMLLSLYKASKGMSVGKPNFSEKRSRKEKIENIMSNVITGKQGANRTDKKSGGGGSTSEDFDGAFFEAAQAFDKKG